MKRHYDLSLYYELLESYFNQLEKETDFVSYFYDAYFNGKNDVSLVEEVELRKFNQDWLKQIESYFPSIDRITKNMKSHLRFESEIIPVEKVKQIDSESIKHLSQHTEYIRSMDQNEIIPEKLKTPKSDVEFDLYENRFVTTLIFRLRDFLNRKINDMEKKLHDERRLTFKSGSKFSFNDSNYVLNLDIKQTDDLGPGTYYHENLEMIEQTKRLYQLVSNLVHTPFVQTMKKYKTVTPPIVRTQMIQKNPDFTNAYHLWTYMDRLHEMKFGEEITHTKKNLSTSYMEDIDRFHLHSVSTLIAHDMGKEHIHDLFVDDTYQMDKDLIPVNLIDPIDFSKAKGYQLDTEYLKHRKDFFKKRLIKLEETFKKSLETKLILERLQEEINDVYQDLMDKMFQDADTAEKKENLLEVIDIIRTIKEKDYQDLLNKELSIRKELTDNHQHIIFEEKKKLSQDSFDQLNQLEKELDQAYREKKDGFKSYVLKETASLSESVESLKKEQSQNINETLKSIRKASDQAFEIKKNKLLDKHQKRMKKLEQTIDSKPMVQSRKKQK